MKRKTLKKCGVVVSTMLILSMLSACGAPADTAVDSSSEKSESSSAVASESSTVVEENPAFEYENVTITLSGPQGATDDWQGTELVAGIEELFGVTMECQPYADDAWATKFSLMLAEDELPDLIINPGISLAQVAEYGAEGYFLPINEYLDHMPNLKALFEEYPQFKMYATSADGNIYTTSILNFNYFNGLPRNFIKLSWLENVGKEMPKTIDELYELLVIFKEQDANGNGDPNDEIPMMWADYSRTIEHTLLPAFGIFPSGASVAPYKIWQADENGKVYLADTTEEFKAYLTWLNKCWEEGLIYEESYSIPIANQREFTKADRVGIFADAQGSIAAGNGDDKDEAKYRWFAGLTSEYQETPQIAVGAMVSGTAEFLISANTEHPEEICRMLDNFFSTDPEAEFNSNGWYGKYTEKQAIEIPGYEEFSNDSYVGDVPEGYDSWETYRHKKMTINEGFNFVTLLSGGPLAVAEGPQELEGLIQFAEQGYIASTWRALMQIGLNENNIERIDPFPTLIYTDDVSDEVTSLSADIGTYLKTTKAQFVTGELDIETEWDNYIATLNKMGLERYTEIQQQAYDTLSGK